MIVWGGYYSGANLNSGGRYNPSTDSWLATSQGPNLPAGRYVHSAVWSGSEMIVWGGFGSGVYLNSGGRYNPATGSWLPTSLGANLPARRGFHTTIWSGRGRIVFWGRNTSGAFENRG